MHICRIIDGSKSTTDLCEKCFKATASPARQAEVARMLAARCRFCGGWPCSTSTDPMQMMQGHPLTMIHECTPCGQMRRDYLLKALEGIDRIESLSQAAQIEIVRNIEAAADAHVRDWLRKNGS
ncbi:MAG: hypothetical protein QM755_07330 [Luteolibacter sp.]